MALENREDVTNVFVSRVCENAPLRELIRVYSEAVQAAIANMSDDDLVNAINQSGYPDILEAFGLTATEAPAADPEAPPAPSAG